METLQIINTILSILGGGFALLVTISKPFRQWLLGVKAEKKAENEAREDDRETQKCLLRDRITSTYFKNCKECEICAYEFENVERMYKQYKKLGGNSFVDKIWEEMQDWNVKK